MQKNKEADGYRYKTVLYWDSISLVYGKDRATGEAARTASESSREMGREENCSKEPTSSAVPLKDEAPKGPTSKEILNTLNEVDGLDEDTLLELFDILTADARKYESLLTLPVVVRKKWLLKQLSK